MVEFGRQEDSDDNTAVTRRRAAVLAGYNADPAAAVRLLTDVDPGVRIAALGAVVRLGADPVAHITAALDDPDATVRRRGAELAASFRSVDLDRALVDDDPRVVEMAAWACGERPDTHPIAALVTIVEAHDDALCREAAVAALGALGDDAGLPAILAACADKATVRRRAVLALAPFEGPDVEAALQAATSDRDWQVRQAAEDLLGIGVSDSDGEEGADEEA